MGALPYFQDVPALLTYWEELSTVARAIDVVQALAVLRSDFGVVWNIGVPMPTLMHQDLNRGNCLSSRSRGGQWRLDAVVDWDAAAVGDWRIHTKRGKPWNILRALGHV